jgi:hypothetical protein
MTPELKTEAIIVRAMIIPVCNTLSRMPMGYFGGRLSEYVNNFVTLFFKKRDTTQQLLARQPAS